METTLSNFISPHRNHRETLLTTPRVRRNSDSVRLRRHSSSSMQSSTQSSPLRSARGPSTLSVASSLFPVSCDDMAGPTG
mmetsp:Transcript_39887/g.125293  ORF Transcript_39887/g.125293 Transcript_39887/m.125293 type:complete len:80 (-) Transcript_39887:313-552(-)